MVRRTLPQHGLFTKKSAQRAAASIVLIGLMILGGLIVVGFVNRAWQEHQLNRAIERQRAENAAQATRNLQLTGFAAWSESDGAVELAARERLGMAREGETVLLPTVVLPPSPMAVAPLVAEAPAQIQTDTLTPPASNVQRWTQAFFSPNIETP